MVSTTGWPARNARMRRGTGCTWLTGTGGAGKSLTAMASCRLGTRQSGPYRRCNGRDAGSGDGQHALERDLGPITRVGVDDDAVAHLSLHQALQDPGQVLGI